MRFVSIRISLCGWLLLMPGLSWAQVWQADLGTGHYRNPVLHADYSDPDVLRVGSDFYLTASSFGHVPGLPILHSTDLVNWQLINYALPQLYDSAFDQPQHGNGVWAPSIRYHQGYYYIFWGDPDRGIYYVRTTHPRQAWEKPVLLKKAYGNIDPCPLWDDDGRLYLVHAFAHSRAGVKSLLQVNELQPGLDGLLDQGNIVFDGHAHHPTVEGPKFYKRNGYYYIFAPAGGVATGWQLVLRARSPMGPYEQRVVLHQGATPINGPHQGAWIELENGQSWFLHFQDREAYGRIVHLQPVQWVDDWPVMGQLLAPDSVGVPVAQHAKPMVGAGGVPSALATSDEFDGPSLGLQWQWQANPKPQWYSLAGGVLGLHALPNRAQNNNLWHCGNLLLQKFPAPSFRVQTSLELALADTLAAGGLCVFGEQWASVQIEQHAKGQALVYVQGNVHGPTQRRILLPSLPPGPLYLACRVGVSADCHFAYSLDKVHFTELDASFRASPGRWVGAKIGLFCTTTQAPVPNPATLQVDWFRVEP